MIHQINEDEKRGLTLGRPRDAVIDVTDGKYSLMDNNVDNCHFVSISIESNFHLGDTISLSTDFISYHDRFASSGSPISSSSDSFGALFFFGSSFVPKDGGPATGFGNIFALIEMDRTIVAISHNCVGVKGCSLKIFK
jgi:hypothetical protein